VPRQLINNMFGDFGPQVLLQQVLGETNHVPMVQVRAHEPFTGKLCPQTMEPPTVFGPKSWWMRS
jgi:hypothetical protein